jgi:hypothetical protein
MGKIMRRSIYVAGALALFAVLATGTEYYHRVKETGRLTLKGQREVFNQRELYRKVDDAERAKYNDSWFQLTVDPGYADNNPKDGIISL